ncbi:E-selectin-like [Anabas testudineus]|uniref:E-selectin-like n=1 Tax=Anabas testudineus TaxID=64144 RepID=UPI000E460482|nr:E-selectin-like [Anabas testudineus]
MITQSCSARYPFICFTDNLVLVKENKTWEEALEYCKALTSPTYSPYQLVSVQPGDDFSYMWNRVMEADTDEVWTGLRFLAGNWMWINGADMLFSDLPLCPLNGQNCGAFSKNDTDSLETRDCLEKKNFLCYSLG